MSGKTGGDEIGGPRSTAAWLYDGLLRTYPRQFRDEFGAEATCIFERLHAEAVVSGPVAVLRLWRRTVIDVVVAGLRERVASRSGREPPRHRRPLVDSVARDVRLSLRGIGRNPGFALTVIALIALGVGATTTIFSVVDGVLLRPLPYPESGRLYRLMKQPASDASFNVGRSVAAGIAPTGVELVLVVEPLAHRLSPGYRDMGNP